MLFTYKSIRLHEIANDPIEVSVANARLAGIYLELGEYRKALALYLRRKEIIASAGDSIYFRQYGHFELAARQKILLYYNIATAYLGLAIPDSALIYAQLSFAENKRIQLQWSALPVLLGDIYSGMGNYSAALSHYDIETAFNTTLDSAKKFIGKALVFQRMNPPGFRHNVCKISFGHLRKNKVLERDHAGK